jgi:filamentous hemagglutinin family protein
MGDRAWLRQVPFVCWVAVSSVAIGLTPSVQAQIIPDDTLPTNSQVTPGCTTCTIAGGTTRGVNLFHSFREFSVPTGGAAYFNNAPAIQNILTRVTGRDRSNIDGLIQTNGTANLFLLNPNGILFGPNARLQIGGSFFATTATRLQFPDGSEFSATNPQAPPLLTVNVAPGLQAGNSLPEATIVNRGHLVAAQDLTLNGDRLDLQGQLQAGRDLTLQAQNLVQIRDTLTTPFLAESGRNLIIQGSQNVDILAINQPQSAIKSGNNLALISNGSISGDAHFTSQGNFSIIDLSGNLGTFVSLYDPIIRANGDVRFGNYTGGALKVETTGSIAGGNITILGPDTTISAADPDFAVLSTSPTLILRAGLPSTSNPNLPQIVGGTNFIPASNLQTGITVGDIDTSNNDGGNGGSVILTTTRGSIRTGTITASAGLIFGTPDSATGNGGEVVLTANNGGISTGAINTSSASFFGNAGNGGNIVLFASGNIITGSLKSSSLAFPLFSPDDPDAGIGGNVSLTSNGGRIETVEIDSSSISAALDFTNAGNAQSGGSIILNGASGIVTGNLSSYSSSFTGTAGNAGNTKNGGEIWISNANGEIRVGDVDSSSSSSSFSLDSRAGNAADAGNGGAITITAHNGKITTGRLSANSDSSSVAFTGISESGTTGSVGNTGHGGAITLAATNGDITTEDLFSTSSSNSNSGTTEPIGNAANGGNITLTVTHGSIRTAAISSYSFSSPYLGNGVDTGNAGNGGSITLVASQGSIFVRRDTYSFSYSPAGSSGNGGAITLSAREGQILGEANPTSILGSFAISQQTAGNGGRITLEAKDQFANLELLTLSSSTNSGDIRLTGFGNLSILNTRLLTSKQYCGGWSRPIGDCSRSQFRGFIFRQRQNCERYEGHGCSRKRSDREFRFHDLKQQSNRQ